jgi:peptidyl-prolyl cis-trans isomerase B (cyclophilin B)
MSTKHSGADRPVSATSCVESPAVSKAAKRERQRQNREAAKIAQAQAARRARLTRSLRSFGIVAGVVVVAVVSFSLISSRGGDDKNAGGVNCSDKKPDKTPAEKLYPNAPAQTIDPTKSYTAKMETSCGTITLALDPVAAPVATNNFVFLARDGYYDGTPIERAATDFLIQGGSRGANSPGYTVNGEVPTDNYPVGALAAAKSGTDPAGAFSSTFFIVTGPNGASLPNDYARFGSVLAGQKVADKVESFAPSTGDGPPSQEVYVFKVSITEGAANTADPSTSSSPAPTPAP